MTTAGVMGLVAEAKETIENLSPQQFAQELEREDVVIVDLRERDELDQQGAIPEAIHAPRGMLEFYADSSTPYHRPGFAPERRTLLYCASGGRSALACQTLKELGYSNVAHLDGGFKAWVAEGHRATEPAGTDR